MTPSYLYNENSCTDKTAFYVIGVAPVRIFEALYYNNTLTVVLNLLSIAKYRGYPAKRALSAMRKHGW